MVKWKSLKVLAILAVFWSSIPMVFATVSVESSTAQASENAVLKTAHPKPAIQTDGSFNDRFIALGLALGLLAFAFFSRKPRQDPPAIEVNKTRESPKPLEIAVPVEPDIVHLVAAELLAANVSAAKRAAENASIASLSRVKNIVVPVDFSPNSELAIRLALVWANPNDKVKIIYCMDLTNAFPPENLTPFNLIDIHPAFENVDLKTAHHWSQLPWVVVLPLAMEIIEQWAVNEFEKLRNSIPIIQREQVEFLVQQGETVNQIVKYSEALFAKLIVLVAHKHSLTDRLINGSHADRLLHVSRIPVIVVCEPVKSEPALPQEILITTDFSSESLPVFAILNDFIQGIKPNITVLTVETAFQHHAKASAVLEGLETAFRSLGLQLNTVKIQAADVEGGILDFVKTHKPQLIAMSSQGNLGFAELIHPSVTKAILHDAGVPILVVHGQAMPTTDTVSNLSDILRMMTGLND
jgi:nucleotide-binding universal stress UspA family protein